jgi:NADPH:quinone reductase-like Zn-dependent oxidoreductase
MKAVYLQSQGDATALTGGDIPKPKPQRGEVLIKVRATAITPTELTWFPTFHTQSGGPRPFPVVLSHEFSGVVDSPGAGIENFKAAEKVYGLNDWFTNGAQAEYCVVAASALARKPTSLDDAHAAVVPMSGLTAWQGLFEKTKLERGEQILIHGAAGGVGAFAVQLAHGHGAHVIATASAANLDFVRSLGADEVIDHRAVPFEDVVHDVDVVFDVVGGETLEHSWKVLKPGGRLVTIVSQDEKVSDQRTRDAFMLVRADGFQLAEIAGLIDAGKLRVFLEQIFPLDQAREAYARAKRGGMRGKIALRVSE